MVKYVAGWNMPGYLPGMEPAEFDEFEDAREYISDELADRYEYHEDDECQADEFNAEASWTLRQTGPFTTSEMPDGNVYWVDIAE